MVAKGKMRWIPLILYVVSTYGSVLYTCNLPHMYRYVAFCSYEEWRSLLRYMERSDEGKHYSASAFSLLLRHRRIHTSTMALPYYRFFVRRGARPTEFLRLTIGRSCLFSSYNDVRPPAYSGILPPDRTKYQGNWCNSPDQYEQYAKFLQEPIPEYLQPFLPAMEAFVVDTWLPTFPRGARLRRLQRDIAFRMLPVDQRPPGKVALEDLSTVVGHLQRRGLVKTAAGRSGRLIIYHVDCEISYYKYRQEHDTNFQWRRHPHRTHPLLKKS